MNQLPDSDVPASGIQASGIQKTGTVQVRAVPDSGEDVTAKEPARARARWSMFASPLPGAGLAKPEPLSSIWTTALPLSTETETLMESAPE